MQLPPSVVLDQATGLIRNIEAALAALPAGAELTIDAAPLRGFDTSLVAVLLHARRLARQAGRGFSITGAPPKLAKLAKLYGVEELLLLEPVEPVAPA